MGGLTREWFELVTKELFNPLHNIFVPCANPSYFKPSPESSNHPEFYKFAGIFLGKAVMECNYVEAPLVRWFYKLLVREQPEPADFQQEDPEEYLNLSWILQNDISDLELDLTFSLGERELVPGGRQQPVTEGNKAEYVRLVCLQKMSRDCAVAVDMFIQGISTIIPYNLICMFLPEELEVLISGLSDVDVYDLRCNTVYVGYEKNHLVVQWFWEILEGFPNARRRKFLQFCTGSSRVPPEGFAGLRGNNQKLQKFNIHKSGSELDLPRAHTCFNQLDLPEYSSKEVLQKKLILAITEGADRFAIA